MKRIDITCKPTGYDSTLDDLHIIQGNLKELSEENYLKLKNSIIQKGFFCPFFVWQHNSINNLMDGTQRKLTLVKMKDEGFHLPDKFPIVVIEAESYTDAKEKLLAITSQYGKITDQGLYEFISDVDIDGKDLKDSFSFDNINFNKFEMEFFDNKESSSDNDFVEDDKIKEKEIDENLKTDQVCPQCGYEF